MRIDIRKDQGEILVDGGQGLVDLAIQLLEIFTIKVSDDVL